MEKYLKSKDEKGLTPLHLSCMNGHDVTFILIKQLKDLDIEIGTLLDSKKRTVMHAAAFGANKKFLQKLTQFKRNKMRIFANFKYLIFFRKTIFLILKFYF